MTVYAQSNLYHITVPAEGFSGCGQLHSRPRDENGEWVKLWALDCEACENHLRHDSQWATTTADLPETYDDKLRRERDEKMGKMDRERQLAEALIHLGPLGDLPGMLAQMLGQISGNPVLAAEMECPNGHGQPAGRKFCAECGSPMSSAPAKAALPASQAAAATSEAPRAGKRPPRLRDQSKAVLQAMAAERGLATGGTNGDLVTRLSDAGVTNNDLAAFLARPAAA